MAQLEIGPVVEFRNGRKLTMLWTTVAREVVTFLFQATEIAVGGGSFSNSLCNNISRLPNVLSSQVTEPASDVTGMFNIVFQVKTDCAVWDRESFTRAWKNKIVPIIRNFERELGDRCNG